MKVTIEIGCDTAGELTAHLYEIIRTIKIRSWQNTDYDFEVGIQFTDNNCYGTHDVVIESN